MNRNTAVICKKNNLKRSCIHYWVIESASGPVSRGTCSSCGAEREFKNYPMDITPESTAFSELLNELG